MNKLELQLTMSESMDERERNNLRDSINSILNECGVPPSLISVKSGSTELLMQWDLIEAAVVGGGPVVAGAFLKKMGEAFWVKVLEYLTKRGSAQDENALNTMPAPSWDIQQESKAVSLEIEAIEKRISNFIEQSSPLQQALQRSTEITFTRREILHDMQQDLITTREQSIIIQRGELRGITESVKTQLNVSREER
jgi:hypothetical protein